MKKIACGLVLVMMAALLQAGVFSSDAQAKYTGEAELTVTIEVGMPHYFVAFDANGGEGTMNQQEFIYGTPQALTPNDFEREEHIFLGWNTAANGSGQGYVDEAQINNLSSTNGETITLYAQWQYEPIPVVFESAGICEFNGEIDGVGQPITGNDCEYAGLTYINTGWELYSEENYEKDFEIGFKIIEYNSNANVLQATFANSKYESGNDNGPNPGFVVRKSGNNIEISQKINGTKIVKTFPGNNVTEVKIARVDGVIYYSVNGGDYTFLQSNVNTTDYHEIPMWFGAAPTQETDEEGNLIPTRFIKAKLSDIYIRVGNFDDSFKNIVTFHANGEGATVNPTEKVYIGESTMGTMPTPVWSDHTFLGWYTEAVGGTRIREDATVTDDMDLYAHWQENSNICEVNGVGKTTIAQCVTLAGTSSTPIRITLLDNVQEFVKINTGYNIELDLNGYTISNPNNSSTPIIDNYGTVKIMNGTLTSSVQAGVINNRSNAYLEIAGGVNVVATGNRQALYNEGGTVDITGSDVLLSAAASQRAAVHQTTAGGIIRIHAGTSVSSKQEGIKIEAGILELGDKDGVASNIAPVVQGVTNALTALNNSEVHFYDGILKGKTAAINDPTKVTDTEDGAEPVEGEETINNALYHTLYYALN